MKGYIYILVNKYIPDLIKLGKTDRAPATRAIELSCHTGVPGKWEVYQSWEVENPYQIEQRLFRKLSHIRETGEFLKIDPLYAEAIISNLLESWGTINAHKSFTTTLESQQQFLQQKEVLAFFESLNAQLKTAINNENRKHSFWTTKQAISLQLKNTIRRVFEENKLSYIFEAGINGTSRWDKRGFRYEGPDLWRTSSLGFPQNITTSAILERHYKIGTTHPPTLYYSQENKILVCPSTVGLYD